MQTFYEKRSKLLSQALAFKTRKKLFAKFFYLTLVLLIILLSLLF